MFNRAPVWFRFRSPCDAGPEEKKRTGANTRDERENMGKRDEGAPDEVSGAVHTDESTLAQEWPFATDFNDHFETPKRAYRDIRPLLRRCARSCGVEPAKLRVYDPYFCR